MVISWIRAYLLRLLNHGGNTHMYSTKHSQLCGVELRASWALPGKERKTPPTELKTFLAKKFFRRKKVGNIIHLLSVLKNEEARKKQN